MLSFGLRSLGTLSLLYKILDSLFFVLVGEWATNMRGYRGFTDLTLIVFESSESIFPVFH